MAAHTAFRSGVTSLALALALAGAVAAQGPASNSMQAVNDWMKANNVNETTVDPGGRWTLGGLGSDNLAFWAILALKDASGEAKVAIRMEYFAPKAVIGNTAALSEMQRLAVDCAGQRLRLLSIQTYPQHNFTGQKTEQGTPNNPWEPAANIGMLSRPIQTVCAQTSAAAAPVATTAPFDIRDTRAARRWMTDNHIQQEGVENARWNMIGVTPQGIWLAKANLEETMTSARNTPTLVLRFERFQAIGKLDGQGTTLSELVFYDINCTTRQFRRSGVNQYDGHNLGGRGNSSGTSDGWAPMAQNAMINSVYGEVCAAATHDALPVPLPPPPPEL